MLTGKHSPCPVSLLELLETWEPLSHFKLGLHLSALNVELSSRAVCCLLALCSLANSNCCHLLQRKRTAHERAKELYSSGEFSSGRKWGDDAPKEEIDTGAVNLIESGACGAFVHGLDDEMYGKYAL